MSKRQPRGIRNNNPGNIRKTEASDMDGFKDDPWMGQASFQNDPDFVVFSAPEWGIRALAKLLRNYQGKQGVLSVSSVIEKYAPKIENPTEHYASFIQQKMGGDIYVDFRNQHDLRRFIVALIAFENGGFSYKPETINKGFDLFARFP